MSHLHQVLPTSMTGAANLLFFSAVVTDPTLSVSNSIVKFADLLILIFMIRAASSFRHWGCICTSHLHQVLPTSMTGAANLLFFSAVVTDPTLNVSNSIVKFADLLILIFMIRAASSSPMSACAPTHFCPPTSIRVMVSSPLNSTVHLSLSCVSPPLSVKYCVRVLYTCCDVTQVSFKYLRGTSNGFTEFITNRVLHPPIILL